MLKVVAGPPQIGARLVADRPIRRGETFLRIRGQRIVKRPTYQTIQVGPARHALALGTLVNLNHSCRPNVVVDTTRMVCVAARDIRRGEELSYFYPSTEWVMARPFLCLCGAPACIRIVAGACHLSADVLARYFINRHIRDMLTRELTAAAGRWRRELRRPAARSGRSRR